MDEVMQSYLGVKEIKAKPMNRLAYNEYRGWDLPEDENGKDEGFLVEYPDSPNSNHPNHDGYISWSPKEVFEKAYRKTSGLTFGLALEALKMGKKVARSGWNGKGMFLFLLPAGTIPKSVIHDPALKSVADEVEGDHFEALGSIRMWTVNSHGRKAVLTGWLASQTDMLEEDWVILD